MSKKKKKRKSKGTGLTKILFEFLERNPDKTYNFKQIASALDLRDTYTRNELLKLVKKLVSEKRIKETVTGRYQLQKDPSEIYEGIIDLNSSGNGYIISDQLEDDLFVHYSNLKGAFHKDKVLFKENKRFKKGNKTEAVVTKIIESQSKYFCWYC